MEEQKPRTLRPVSQFRQTRRNLPHWESPGQTYFVTFNSTCGHLPEAARQLAFDACLFWHGKRCTVHACVVMPDHVHMLLTPLQVPEGGACHSLSALLHSIKSYSANRINKLLRRRGPCWLDESHDRIVRNERELYARWNYIRENPVTMGIVQIPEEYPFLYEEGVEDHRQDACAPER